MTTTLFIVMNVSIHSLYLLTRIQMGALDDLSELWDYHSNLPVIFTIIEHRTVFWRFFETFAYINIKWYVKVICISWEQVESWYSMISLNFILQSCRIVTVDTSWILERTSSCGANRIEIAFNIVTRAFGVAGLQKIVFRPWTPPPTAQLLLCTR